MCRLAHVCRRTRSAGSRCPRHCTLQHKIVCGQMFAVRCRKCTDGFLDQAGRCGTVRLIHRRLRLVSASFNWKHMPTELGADVADGDARQRPVRRQRPDLHDECVRPIVLRQKHGAISLTDIKGIKVQMREQVQQSEQLGFWPTAATVQGVTCKLTVGQRGHTMRSLRTGDYAASFTLPFTKRRAMATTCVAVLPKPAALVRRL